ncbi:hypothetical protein [Sphingomonas sp. LHG3406-1]|uniref:hypothetical protein n=1 Tax=Sphingomonas sp. LHG3406-1 TaxID=2804617 RepID=UPI00261D0F6B|nr:hypothetical protein [Sphingomonas sp. LHG3406-1]
MKRVFEEDIGDAKLVIAQAAEGYVGTLWREGKRTDTIQHSDLGVLKASLRNQAGKLHPDYYGIEGAKARFCSFFPGGFSDATYQAQERDYKDKARAALLAVAPLEEALDATSEIALACRKGLATNLLSRFEAARLSEVLASNEGPAFVRAAASFALEPSQECLDAMEKAILPHGRSSWPLVTYLPYFWAPETQMFLKPEATNDFALRVGHHFARAYESTLNFDVYVALLELAQWTEREIQELEPRDRIDVQSFIWVVGDYTDADRMDAPAP